MQRFRSAAAGLVFLLLLLTAHIALCEGALEWIDLPAIIRPGKSIRLSFSASLAGSAIIVVKDEAGATAATIAEDFPAKAGRNNLTWDGKSSGSPLPPGAYTLEIVQGSASATAAITIGEVSPAILSAFPSDTHMSPGDGWYLKVETNLAATLAVKLMQDSGDFVLYEASLPAGTHEIPWDGTAGGQALSPGSYNLLLTLTDDTGFSSNGEQFTITVEGPATAPAKTEAISIVEEDRGEKPHSPADFSSHTCTHESCFFTLPMGVMDEAAIWKAMMQPMTVVKGEQRQLVKVYETPDKNSKAIGEVTCTSQGLHVLETLDNGWTLVEAYSSSIHTSKVKNWAGFFSGYIETSKLKQSNPTKNSACCWTSSPSGCTYSRKAGSSRNF